MGMLDFLKKKELAEIQRLSTEVQKGQNSIHKLSDDLRQKEETIQTLSKYQGIVDVDAIVSEKLEILAKEEVNLAQQRVAILEDICELKEKYTNAHKQYLNLKHQIDLYTESLDLSEYGVYEPHFSFDTSEAYKKEILTIREMQIEQIKQDCAVIGGHNI